MWSVSPVLFSESQMSNDSVEPSVEYELSTTVPETCTRLPLYEPLAASATVTRVLPDRSLLAVIGTLDESVMYRATVTSIPLPPLGFAVVGAGDEVASKKPAPDIYEWVLDKLDLPAGDCLAIEDSTQGVGAARAADVPTIVTFNAYTADDDFAGALVVVSSLGDADNPARPVAGLPLAGELVDLAQLLRWHQHASEQH